MSVNKVIVIGYVGNVHPAEGGQEVVNFSVATSERWTDKGGSPKEHTEWFNCVAFGSTAKIIMAYVEKGTLLYVEGKMRTEKYTAKDGSEKSSAKVVVANVRMLGGKEKKQESDNGSTSNEKPEDFLDDDIPF